MTNALDTLYSLDGATITATGVGGSLVSDPIQIGRPQGHPPYEVAWLSVYVKGSVTGTTPSLTVTYEQQDALGNWLTIKQLTAITTGPNFVTDVLGAAGAIPLAPVGRIRWTVTGTGSPTFNDVDISLIGR